MSVKELEKTLSELNKELTTKEKEWRVQYLKYNKDIRDIQNKIEEIKLKNLSIKDNTYYYTADKPMYHFSIFTIYKVLGIINKRNIYVIEYDYRSDDGELTFKVKHSTKKKEDFTNLNEITDEEFNAYITKAINLKEEK